MQGGTEGLCMVIQGLGNKITWLVCSSEASA